MEIHGAIMQTHCLARCGFVEPVPAQLPPGEPPRCPRCGDWLRPGVVWFGEMLDPARLAAAEASAATCEAGLPAVARRTGATIVVVNPAASELDDLADIVIRSTAAVALPRLLAA